MFCTTCGARLVDNAAICMGCGCAAAHIEHTGSSGADTVQTQSESSSSFKEKDGGGCLWVLIGSLLTYTTGFIVPLLLIIAWRKEYPRRTRALTISLIIDAILTVFVWIPLAIILIVFVVVPMFGYGGVFADLMTGAIPVLPLGCVTALL